MASEARRQRRAFERAASKEARKQARRQTKGPSVQLKVTTPLYDYLGEPIADGNLPVADGGEPMTLWTLVWLALNNYRPGEVPTGDEKLKQYRLTTAAEAARRSEDGMMELTLEDAMFLKTQAADHVTAALLFGRLVDALEPPALPEEGMPAPPAEDTEASSNGQGDPPVVPLAEVEPPA